MVHVLLLLAQEVRGDAVQRVARQLVVSLHRLHQVELHAPLDGDLLAIARAVGFAGEGGVLHAQLAADHPPPVREVLHAQLRRAVNEVREVEVHDVVPDEQVGVGAAEELPPRPQELALVRKAQHVRPDDGRARVEGPDGADRGLVVALAGDHGGDLDHGVVLGVGEVALAPRALDIHGQNAERRELAVLALWRVRYHRVVAHVALVLAHGLLLLPVRVPAGGELHPVPAHHAAVHHEPQRVQHVALERLEAKRGVVQAGDVQTLLLENAARRRDLVRQRTRDLDERARLSLLVVHQRLLPAHNLHGADEHGAAVRAAAPLLLRHHLVQVLAEALAHAVGERVGHLGVEVRLEAVHVHAHGVASRGDAEDAQHRRGPHGLALRTEHGVRLADDVVDVQLLEHDGVLRGVHGGGGLAFPVLALGVRDDHLRWRSVAFDFRSWFGRSRRSGQRDGT